MNERNRELGRTGLRRYGGMLYEEYDPELRGLRGVKVWSEMENDATVAALMFAIKNLIRQTSWRVQAAGSKDADKRAAEFLESNLEDMSNTWQDTLSEILSFLIFGWSVHEICYKRRMGRHKDSRLDSKYSDGLIGWQKLPIRAQETLYEWEFDAHDNLTAFVQMPAPDYEIIRIPAEKILIFRTESRKGNPEGRSILRGAYHSWYFKKRLQELEAIGVERDLAGYPVLVAPDGVDIWSENNVELYGKCLEFVQNIRRDSMEGLVLPAGWSLQLLSTGSRRSFDTNQIIQRYSTEISMTVLADFILLGHESVGSFALSSDKTRLFAVAVGTYLDIIADVFNRYAIPKLLNLNSKAFPNLSGFPMLLHDDIETADLKSLGEFLKTVCGLGLIEPDEQLENYLRTQANLPERI